MPVNRRCFAAVALQGRIHATIAQALKSEGCSQLAPFGIWKRWKLLRFPGRIQEQEDELIRFCRSSAFSPAPPGSPLKT